MDNLGWGLQITALGMGLVFGLLALLWALLTLVLRLDRPAGAGAAAGPAGTAGAASGSGAAADMSSPAAISSDALRAGDKDAAPDPDLDPAMLAAITVAVLTHSALMRAEASPAMRAHWPGSLLHASRWVASGRLRQNRTFRKGR